MKSVMTHLSNNFHLSYFTAQQMIKSLILLTIRLCHSFTCHILHFHRVIPIRVLDFKLAVLSSIAQLHQSTPLSELRTTLINDASFKMLARTFITFKKDCFR